MIEEDEKKPEPNLLWSVFTMRCPRCRQGDLFKNKKAYRKLKIFHIVDMYESCPVCHQKFNLEPGFWFGTIYVSYAIAVIISGISFCAWWLIIGFSINDNRVFFWLIFNAFLLLVLQPWIMRMSRVIYLYLFIKYNKNFENEAPEIFH